MAQVVGRHWVEPKWRHKGLGRPHGWQPDMEPAPSSSSKLSVIVAYRQAEHTKQENANPTANRAAAEAHHMLEMCLQTIGLRCGLRIRLMRISSLNFTLRPGRTFKWASDTYVYARHVL
jgi:hypothetical protein